MRRDSGGFGFSLCPAFYLVLPAGDGFLAFGPLPGSGGCLPLASLAGPKWVAPHVERAAANSIADMFSAPHLENGRDTVADLDVQGLVEDDPPAFAKLLHHYGASIEELRAMPPNSTSADYLAAITREYAAALSKSVLYAVLFTAFFLSARLAARRIELNLVPPAPLRGARRLIPAGNRPGGRLDRCAVALGSSGVAAALCGARRGVF